MIKAFVSSSSSIPTSTTVSSSSNPHHQQQYTTINPIKQEQEQQLATRIVLRLTSYGMTDHVYCQCEECPFLKWNGYPIMRFVHPDHVHRLCAGLCEASKTGMAISISDIHCTLDSSCSSTSSSSYDTTIHLTVHESHSLYLCVLYYYPNDILKYNNNNSKTITTTIHDRDSNNSNNNTNRQPVVLNLAREIMVASLVLLQLIFHYSYYLFPIKLLLRHIIMLLSKSKKDS